MLHPIVTIKNNYYENVEIFAFNILCRERHSVLWIFSPEIWEPEKKTKAFVPPKGCVLRTVMGEESSDLNSIYKTPENVQRSVDRGLSWIIRAQNQNGGWGAGSHGRQDILNPHAVQADPATTAMVSMALLRSGRR